MAQRSHHGGGHIVIVKRDGNDGSRYPLPGGDLTIGSGKECTIRIKAQGVAPKHCVINIQNGQAIVKNLSSDTPTLVNELPVESRLLRHGDIILVDSGKFRWDYVKTPSRKSASGSAPSLKVRQTRKSVARPPPKRILASAALTTRQVAIVRPQRRYTEAPDVNPPSDRVRNRTKSEGAAFNGSFNMKRNGVSVHDAYGSGSKRRKLDTIEKLENPSVLDKNKRAAFLLMNARSPGNKNSPKNTSNVIKNISPNKKTPINTSKSRLLNAKSNSIGPKNSIPVRMTKLQTARSESKAQQKATYRTSVVTRHSKIPVKLNGTLLNGPNRKANSTALKRTSRVKIESVTENVPDVKSKDPFFNISGVEAIIEHETNGIVPRKSRSSMISVQEPSTSTRSSKMKSPMFNNGPALAGTPTKLNSVKRNSQKVERTNSIVNMNYSAQYVCIEEPAGSARKSSKTPKSSVKCASSEKLNNSEIASLISSLSKALKVVNNPNSSIDMESILKTPEFCTLNNQLSSAVKKLDMVDTPSPKILEIGNMKASVKRASTRRSQIESSPIISPRHKSANISDSSLNETVDVTTTPNLSKLFSVEASTPLEDRKSVRERIKQFESMDAGSARRSTRNSTISKKSIGKKTLIKKTKFDPTNTDPKKKNQKHLRSRQSVTVAALKAMNRKNQSSDGVSNCSDSTDVNAPTPNNEIVVTPKSTMKPVPEVLKEKHSTAKKPVSKKTIIDHLTRSPEVVKELFKSPVKRKLSQSMKQYDSSHVFDDVQDLSLFSDKDESPRRSSTRSSAVVVSFNFENTNSPKRTAKGKSTSPRNETNVSVVDKQTPTPSKSTKNSSKGARRLLVTPKSPKNDLTNVRGVKKLMATPRPLKSPRNSLRDLRGVKQLLATPRPPKSPRNDLRDVRGVKKVLATPKLMKSPKNDLRDVRGVKRVLATPKPTKSPKNDLRDVRGVKKLVATPKPKKSPKNDLRDVRGVKKILATPRLRKSPKNDLRNVSGVKNLLGTPPKKAKSPMNDLRNVSGLQQLLTTPLKKAKSPNNSRTINGIQQLPSTPPKKVSSPKNDAKKRSPAKRLTDLIGVKQLFKKSPNNDLRNVSGVNLIMKTPKKVTQSRRHSPRNELTNIEGINTLFTTPESKVTAGGVRALRDSTAAVLFDSLVGKTPRRTYSNSKKGTPIVSPKKNLVSNKSPNNVPTESNIIQDMKSAFMKETRNNSIELKNDSFSKKVNVSLSKQPQSTPAPPRRGKVSNETELKISELSPITVVGLKPQEKKARAARVKEIVEPSPKKVRATRAKKSPVKSPKLAKKPEAKVNKKSQVKKANSEKEATINVEVPPPGRKTRTLKSVLSPSKGEPKSTKKSASRQKKKVSFAKEVNMIDIESNKRTRTTRSAKSGEADIPVEKTIKKAPVKAPAKVKTVKAPVAAVEKKTRETTKKVATAAKSTKAKKEAATPVKETSKRPTRGNKATTETSPKVSKSRAGPASKSNAKTLKSPAKTTKAVESTPTKPRGRKRAAETAVEPAPNAKKSKTTKTQKGAESSENKSKVKKSAPKVAKKAKTTSPVASRVTRQRKK